MKGGLAEEVMCEPVWKDEQEMVRRGRGVAKATLSRGEPPAGLDGEGRTAAWEGLPPGPGVWTLSRGQEGAVKRTETIPSGLLTPPPSPSVWSAPGTLACFPSCCAD